MDAVMQYRPRIVHAWLTAKREFAAIAEERDALRRERDDLERQLTWIVAEVAELTRDLRELRAAALRRANAQAELVALHREAAIQRAEQAERDEALPLQ